MADNFKFAQLQPFTLAGSGVSIGDSTVALSSFKTIDGVNLAMTDFGDVGFGTIDPGNGTSEEQISFTGVTQNANGTATLTGVKTVLFTAPYTQTPNLAKSHAGGSIFVISNTAGFYNELTAKDDDETITGQWTFTDPKIPQMDVYSPPVSDVQLATKKYVDDTAAGGSVSVVATIVPATAGETISAGQAVYFDETDNEWKLTDANTATTVNNVLLGIAQGAGTNGNAISGGVLLFGQDTKQSGLTQGDKLYLSDTAGAISNTPGTIEVEIGVAITATTMDFSPRFASIPTAAEKDALVGNGGTVGSSNTYVTQTGYQEGTETFGASSSGNDTYAVTLSPAPSAYTNGMRVWLRPDTSNTGACTLNVNGLGAVNIKISGDDPQTNSIIAGQTYCFVYNSTGPVFELETTPDVLVAGSTSDASAFHTHKGVITVSNGATTRGSGATGTQTITHNLNVVPRSIEIKVVRKMSTNQAGSSLGFYDAGGQNCIGWNGTTTSPVVSANTSRVAYNLNQSSQVDWEGTLQNVTTTQFDISWATIRSDGGSGDLQILWRAIA